MQRNDKIIVSWDTAMSSRELADYSACIIAQVRGENVYVLDVFRARLEYPALKRKVIEIHEFWRYMCPNYMLLIEKKGSGMCLIQDLGQQSINAIAVQPEGDKIMRMSQQTARIEAGCVFLPERASWLSDFRAELMAFPGGRHNDQVDALSQLLYRAFHCRSRPVMWGSY
jgi:predicted phage terminase large subunit-like protein